MALYIEITGVDNSDITDAEAEQIVEQAYKSINEHTEATPDQASLKSEEWARQVAEDAGNTVEEET
jgi:hypothetical protein